MATQLIKNIKVLAGTGNPGEPLRGKDLASLGVIPDAFIVIEDGMIAELGRMAGLSPARENFSQVIDASGRAVLPAWCDSHTHLVFPASREEEFVQKIQGRTYAEIAASGGGILNSARRLNETPGEKLFENAWSRLNDLMKLGTGAIEIKSGYGLSVEGELKMLRVIKKLKERSPIPVKATFLGAHSYPVEFRDDHETYIRMITDEMLPVIAREGLADYIDVFCEEGFYSVEETERIVGAGLKSGLKPRLHVNQLNSIGGVPLGVGMGAVSLDHLETMTPEDIRILSESSTIGTLLPTAAFFLRMNYQPARALIENNCAVALASDFNPGSSPSGNMNFVVALSCIQMKMLPEEAINAATINGAFAMELQNELGSIAPGKRANLIITKKIPSISFLPYAFGSNMIEMVLVNGERI